MDPVTRPKRRTPKALAVTNGVLAADDNRGTVYLWEDQGHRPRLLVIGPRRLLAGTGFHILIDDTDTFLFFKAGVELGGGNPNDVVFAFTPPLDVRTRLVVRVVWDGAPRNLGVYYLRDHNLVADDVDAWVMTLGFPLRIADAAAATQQREAAALLKNFKALKTSWPQMRAPAIAVAKNTELPLPEAKLRHRIEGQSTLSDPDGARFLESGFVQMQLVLRIAEVYGAPFASGFTVLDWGVGCGRIARHMPPLLQFGLTGIDVDPVNIEWCRTHLPFGQYTAVDPFSRTDIADRRFDLIYSHSVLTHLAEPDQFHWLQELARISRGIMILSVSGLYGAHLASWSRHPAELRAYLDGGFRNAQQTLPDIEDVTPAGYYRMICHTPAYIRANWSRFVEVLDIIPGGFGTRQDAVICRPLAPP